MIMTLSDLFDGIAYDTVTGTYIIPSTIDPIGLAIFKTLVVESQSDPNTFQIVQQAGTQKQIEFFLPGLQNGISNARFRQGRVTVAGVGLNEYRFIYVDDSGSERTIFLIESAGTVASVSDGVRRSHYEAYEQDGITNPDFRLTSYPLMTLELGAGGFAGAVGQVSRTSNVVTVHTNDVHSFRTGDIVQVTGSDGLFPIGSFAITSTADSTHFTYVQTGSNGVSTNVLYFSIETDIKLRRLATGQLGVIMGPYGSEITKIIFYEDAMATQANYDLAIGGGLILANAAVTHASSPVTMGQVATYLAGAAAGTITMNLPAASAKSGRDYVVKKVDSTANAITLTAAGSDKIDGASTFALSAQYKFVHVQSDGVANWYVIGSN